MKQLEEEDKIYQSSKKREKEPLWNVHDDAKINPDEVLYY